MDTATKDRTITPILGVADADQPVRTMTISGIENSVSAKILSTNLRGANTRIVRLLPGWGSRLPGSFNADLEVFVLKGELRVGPHVVTDYEHVAITSKGVVGGFRTERGAIALLMTAGPIRYDTASGGAPAKMVIGRPADSEWSLVTEQGHFVRPIANTPTGEVWLGSTVQGRDSPVWIENSFDEETFVLEGTVEYQDVVHDEIVTTGGSPGHYFYRPAGTRHSLGARIGDETVITFHRSLGHSAESSPGEA